VGFGISDAELLFSATTLLIVEYIVEYIIRESTDKII
jgi:hypothetical protein